MYVREHKEVQQPIDMRKVVHVVSYCSRPLPHGTKCNLQFQEVVKAILLLVVNKPVAFGWTNYTSSIM